MTNLLIWLRVTLKLKRKFPILLLIYVFFALPSLTGCNLGTKPDASAQPSSSESRQDKGNLNVEVETAQTGVIQEPLEYTGNTEPEKEVSLRSQAEGRLLNLNADTGDFVKQGQILAQLDDALLLGAVSEAEAELTALQSEVARAKTEVSNAQVRAQQARLELQQAESDAARLARLAKDGAISEQEAELAQTAAATARQGLQVALQQISTEQKAVEAAESRVKAQRATVAQNRERQSYALLASPITGVVLEKLTEPGNLVTPGSEILKLGDFSRVKVVVPVSELELANIRVGQSAEVYLDAFPRQSLRGKVTRISPAADQRARQVPVEVTVPNPNGRIGSGLLARVSFASRQASTVVVPETSFKVGKREKEEESRRDEEGEIRSKDSGATVFVVSGEGSKSKVEARTVQVGDRSNDKVEILSGLQPGERFVVRSSKPLKDGDTVQLSILSQ
ncbi:MAG: efflux RND transporter periplasmic adaptor subunit [Coleofasciculaceae cyanobacterium]